jgi:hypothetical protein
MCKFTLFRARVGNELLYLSSINSARLRHEQRTQDQVLGLFQTQEEPI